MKCHFRRLYQITSNRILKTIIPIVNYINNLKIKILINNGLDIGENIFIGNNVSIDPVFPWMISIGSGCVLTNGVIILAHDSSLENRFGCGKVGKVSIGKNTFVGVKSIILPGVKIGENVIIGAGSVVTTEIPNDCVVVGNPARIICSTFEYLEKHRKNMEFRPIYDGRCILNDSDPSIRQVMKKELRNGIGYFRADPKTQNCFSESLIPNDQSSFDHRK